ncbi:hypothetical protein GCM10010412_100690 [Nonomuraea recticatena]|uniref:Uncharacterized protein n=1 Tax=Nonomuraea recticatena TaxID=46178 RepID=A0ABP6FWN2_9ACTN
MVKLTEDNGAYATWVFDQKTSYPLELKDAEANANSTARTGLAYEAPPSSRATSPIWWRRPRRRAATHLRRGGQPQDPDRAKGQPHP